MFDGGSLLPRPSWRQPASYNYNMNTHSVTPCLHSVQYKHSQRKKAAKFQFSQTRMSDLLARLYNLLYSLDKCSHGGAGLI